MTIGASAAARHGAGFVDYMINSDSDKRRECAGEGSANIVAEPRGNHADRRSGFNKLVDRTAVVETELAKTM